MPKSAQGLIFVLLSSLCYALTGLVSKVLLNSGMEPLLTVTLRNGGCCLLLGLGLLAWNRGAFKLNRADFKDILIVCLFMFIYSAAYFFALVYLNFSIAVILLYTYPSMVVIASVVIYKEKLNKAIIASLALTFGGLLMTLNLFSGQIDNLSATGVALALLAAVGAAGFALYVKKLTKSYNGATINFYCFLATVVGYSLMLLFNPPAAWPDLADLGRISLSVVPYTLALLFYALGLKYLSAGKVGIVGSSEPAFGIILSLIFLGEYISLPQWLGAGAILASIFIIQISSSREEQTQENPNPTNTCQ